ncbi:MAG: tRNA uridine-5-carboxymethylaminomethyl(34) synthesis GTPase MnmE [Gammaproteobacteria bacterium]|nr:tRNA uridine-5-carboxymethylaminomethyl(34) synthesis GTPase MnmE [Gammaproteobacteria bacterium]
MIAADTIVAIATPPGRGAVGIVRVSGPETCRLAAEILGRTPAPRRAEYAGFRDADGGLLDRGLALYFPAPHSFTGEDVLELQGHGGPVVLDLILRRLVALGGRLALPGEFSQRAFLNGKIDVTQAEAVADLIGAGSAAAARAAVRSLQGEFSARIHELQGLLTGLRVRVEASIDFPDDEVPLVAQRECGSRLAQILAVFDPLQAAAQRGTRLVEGLTVVIAGEPNVGKSSLLNRLAGDEVAIVTDTPGTTRDLLRHHVLEGGVPLHLIDTAGLRETVEPVEAEGIRRARAAMRHADLVVYLVDVSLPQVIDPDAIAERAATLAPGVPFMLVLNKIDLLREPPVRQDDLPPPGIRLSAKTGEGLETLRARLRAAAGECAADAAPLTARRRHLDALRRARAHLDQAAAVLDDTAAVELFAEELRLAQRDLGEITGEMTSDDLLGEIFGSFCIGK